MTQTVKCFLTAAGLSKAVPPRNASLMSALRSPWEVGGMKNFKHAVNTADGVRDIPRYTTIDGALLAGRNGTRQAQQSNN